MFVLVYDDKEILFFVFKKFFIKVIFSYNVLWVFNEDGIYIFLLELEWEVNDIYILFD